MSHALLDPLLVLLILTCFLLLGSSRLGACIRIGAFQGILVGLLPLAVHGRDFAPRVAAIGSVIVVLKGFVFPRLLTRALRESDTSREVQPFIGYSVSLVAGLGALLASFWLDARLELPLRATSGLATPVADGDTVSIIPAVAGGAA